MARSTELPSKSCTVRSFAVASFAVDGTGHVEGATQPSGQSTLTTDDKTPIGLEHTPRPPQSARGRTCRTAREQAGTGLTHHAVSTSTARDRSCSPRRPVTCAAILSACTTNPPRGPVAFGADAAANRASSPD